MSVGRVSLHYTLLVASMTSYGIIHGGMHSCRKAPSTLHSRSPGHTWFLTHILFYGIVSGEFTKDSVRPFNRMCWSVASELGEDFSVVVQMCNRAEDDR